MVQFIYQFVYRSSPKPKKDSCTSCGEGKRMTTTTDVQTQTMKDNASVGSKNSQNPVFDYVS